ncbi:hypothetical protein KTD19_05220 [Burkholderia multivorans]|uniref:hypothetical protein n=1 Tax=Burkholderia multivorans TaxID=87883 RepID=UPI0011B215F8|nr:hypothetical protein [Burkholderia multivorans]MBU9231781.1 hypothetical protein [Burkholderia multivorans]MCA8318448.1 hypothetical protein [Burkholderia multivorans]MDN7479064.1 hypothetical protein [Burkholderia multivorans]MDN7862116.1 hypothetical protein [Burkholderia multivorans]MDN7971718.1 hypothetical protein [Burkholderia multivorans]
MNAALEVIRHPAWRDLDDMWRRVLPSSKEKRRIARRVLCADRTSGQLMVIEIVSGIAHMFDSDDIAGGADER